MTPVSTYVTSRVAAIEVAVQTAQHYLGKPYRWGGDDPSGFDCSGFVLECLKSAGLIGDKEDFTADALLNRFKKFTTGVPKAGCLAFRRDQTGKAVHVRFCLSDRYWIGADGGGSVTKDDADAWAQNAYIKIRPIRNEPGQIFVFPFEEVFEG